MYPVLFFGPKGKLVKQAAPGRQMFSADEDQALRRLVSQFGDRDWIAIASQMPNRTTRQCRERYKSYLSPELTNQPWSDSEDDLLREKFREWGPKWATIAGFFKGRSDVALKNRWATLSARPDGTRFILTPVEPPLVPDVSVPRPHPDAISIMRETVSDPIPLPPVSSIEILRPVPLPAEFSEQLPPLRVEPGQSDIGARDAAPARVMAMMWPTNDRPAEFKPGKDRFENTFPNYGGRVW
jgi:hypothetical protein